MRSNLPISNNEYQMQDGRPIVSKTDLKGKITYVNPYFIEVSGFLEEELIGAPHNIVRHPDMPEEAFKDLWCSLKEGELWSALVKNRRKNGDYYWVIANVTPITENGQIVGYMSVRTKPTREQVAAATAAYAEVRKGPQSRLTVIKGQARQKGVLTQLRRLGDYPLTKLVNVLCSFIFVCVAISFAAHGFSTNHKAFANGIMLIDAFAGILIVLFWIYLYRVIATPIAQATQLAKSLAGGDLANHDVLINHGGDVGRLLQALQQLNVNLMATIGDIRSNVDVINTAIGEIAAGNMDLSSRTEMQASSLEETASSMEEFASTVTSNAISAQDACQLAKQSSLIAIQGGESVANVGKKMDEISESSKRVTDIISVIDGIAFQTNILALNAAVEAARAGETGRGFAVVAAEVRSLAQRSASAAKEIKTLIQSSVTSVEAGHELVAGAQKTMNKIVESVEKLTIIVEEIASASKEQATGVQQVNQAVSQMDQVTQQNAALVEEAAAASASLKEQAMRLSHAVAVFKYGD